MPVRCFLDVPREKAPRLRAAFGEPRRVARARALHEVLPVLQEAEFWARAGGWAIGFVAYEAARAFEPTASTRPPDPELPLAAFAFFDAPDAVVPPAAAPDAFACGVWRYETDARVFESRVAQARQEIAAGAWYQTNLTTRLRASFAGDAFAFFEALRKTQPDGYGVFLDLGDAALASVSPELFFAFDPATRLLTTRPMKGTATPEGGAASRRALQRSPKDRAENLMIVDLLRNDLARVAEPGSVEVASLFDVQALPTALQMTSTITATARRETRLADLFRALFPCGSVTGAPKLAAMKAIAAFEDSPRGVYCGAIGFLAPGGAAQFSVGIRTVVIGRNGHAVCGVGSGITWDSTPRGEAEETRLKARFLWRASASFRLLETLRLSHGRYLLRPLHVARLRAGAAHFGFPFSPNALDTALRDAARRHPEGILRARILLDRAGAVAVETGLMPVTPPAPRRVVLADRPVTEDPDFLRFKTTQRAAYDAFAPPDGVFDTLLVNAQGRVTEFTRGNLVAELDGELVTPPAEDGLLPGARRALWLRQGRVRERSLAPDDLRRATRLFFLNSLRGALEVRLR